jgi:glycosyltransferase involved in cell wall biosynthesis
MKILIPVDPEIPVPPTSYGGVERLVDGLAIEYSNQGYEVVLVAHEASTAAGAARIYRWPAQSSRGFKNVIKNAWMLKTVLAKEKPDIVHSFCRLLYHYPNFLGDKYPVVQTYGRAISPHSTLLASIIGSNKLHFTCCGKHMLSHLKGRKRFSTIYNFTDFDYFNIDTLSKREHVMFLGRIEDIKGTREAVDAALKAGEKIVIAGNIQPGHESYFRENIQQHLDNPLVEYVGPVNDEQKRLLLQKAKALLFPIKWEEPFGIVMVEAMACGTPIIAFRRGSVPEVVDNISNGYIVDDVEQMATAILKAEQLDKQVIRSKAKSCFSQEKIGQDYLSLFQNVLANL